MDKFSILIDLNETLINCLTDFKSINHFAIHRACIMDNQVPICNLVLRATIVHFLKYYVYETKEHISIFIRKSVRSGGPHLTPYIITQLHPLNWEEVELFVLCHGRLHGIEPPSE